MNEEILKIENLKTYFPIRGYLGRIISYVHAVDGISFSIDEGKTFGLVGESGSGKTTVGKSILRLVKPTDGKIYFKGTDLSKKENEKIIRSNMQIIFQNALGSCNPRRTIGSAISEPLEIHNLVKKDEKKHKVISLMREVGLEPELYNKYPHELSGGQVQRVVIARALSLRPKFIVADEPVSALDASIQAQNLNLLMDLQKEYNITYLFIAHDLNIIKYVSNQIGVMYLGKIMELATTKELFNNVKHPYSEALISASLEIKEKKQRILLKGEIPSPINPPLGCRFHTRCQKKIGKICENEEPESKNIGKEHFVSCHLYL